MARRALAIAVIAIGCGDKRDAAPPAPPPLAKPAATAPASTITIAGSVIDKATGTPVGDVQVVLLGSDGEVTTATDASGAFSIKTAPGAYRAFVRARKWITLGRTERVRLDNQPREDLVGKPDVGIMPLLDARANLEHVELIVAPAIEISGVVYSPDEQEVAGAVVRVRDVEQLVTPLGQNTRPVLGTDMAITDEHGQYSLFVAAGSYELDVSHPQFAGVEVGTAVDVSNGTAVQRHAVHLARGCIVSGRVVQDDGSPAPDGAIERLGGRTGGFGPAGRIDASTFRWSTTEEGPVMLRAWPWHSPPSPARTFECRDGKRYDDVVLRLPDERPDISGTIVDLDDRPLPLAYIDIQPLDFGTGQQERADAAGSWHVYHMPAGRYRITAMAPGHGVVDTTVIAPRQDLRLALGGTGRIVGTTTDLASGSVEVSFLYCGSKDQPLQITHDTRIAPVVGGRFTIERAPACTLSLAVRWRDKLVETVAVVEPDRTAYVEIDVGEPRAKTITGVVRDASGNAVEGARVTAVLHDRESATARTDASGHYTLTTHAGAQLVAGKGERVGRRTVGRANVASEQVDLILDDADY